MSTTTTKQWTLTGTNGPESLVFAESPLPPLGDTQVLVQLHAASLNYRDLLITRGQYPWRVRPNVVLGSDGAGTIVRVGREVTRFAPGDEVLTMLNATHISGSMTAQIAESGLGASRDGTLRTLGAFEEQGVVRMPRGVSFGEAAALGCAGVTAWNALFGLPGKSVGPGQWVLTQGTGGVSLGCVQLAKAVGARVIATTSEGEGEKVELLRRLGADHVVNYREREDWGVRAKELTEGVGVDVVVDVAGARTLQQSAEAVKLDGMVVVVGFVGGEAGSEKVPTLLECWMNLYTARGIWVGSRMQLEELCRAVEANPDRLRPIVDQKKFKLGELKEAFEYMLSGKNLGKVCIEID